MLTTPAAPCSGAGSGVSGRALSGAEGRLRTTPPNDRAGSLAATSMPAWYQSRSVATDQIQHPQRHGAIMHDHR
jgi:hypothetical protein